MTLSESLPRRGADTRERLLDLAEAAVLEKGFAATSIDELIAGCGDNQERLLLSFQG